MHEFTCQNFDHYETRLVLEVTKLKIHHSIKIYFKTVYKFFCGKSNRRNSRSLLEKLYWLPLGELVNLSPRKTQAACPGFSVPSLASVAVVKRGRGRGRGNSAWGAQGREERNACKDAIVFSVFHAQILSVKIVIGQR